MVISRDQAADALQEIESIAARSQELKNYSIGAPILMMWGVICMIGYGATAASPAYALVWTPLSLIGAAATFLMSRRAQRETGSRIGARIGWTWAALLVFYVGTFAVLRPHEPNQFLAFPAMLVALSYLLMGIWTWPRYAVLGAAIGILTLFGYFMLTPLFAVWMAMTMGVGLVLGGLWLRKA